MTLGSQSSFITSSSENPAFFAAFVMEFDLAYSLHIWMTCSEMTQYEASLFTFSKLDFLLLNGTSACVML